MKRSSLLLGLLLGCVSVHAQTEILPGFRVDAVARFSGFVSSIAVDSKGTLYCTTTNGRVHRVAGGALTTVAVLPTRSGGNGGLLGMGLLDDVTAVVHYTTWDDHDRVLDDVISTVDLTTGDEQVLKAFPCDIEFRERGGSDEHHGGNPTVADDGTIFVGIGDYAAYALAQDSRWNGGKIWRLDRQGNAQQFALGLRNPYDLAWDPELRRLVVADNGPTGGDEIHIIDAGANCGWPDTVGNEPPVPGRVTPDYVFPATVAPTGLLRLRPTNAMLGRGYLLGAFVTRALYYFPDLAARPVAHPIPIVKKFGEFVIDVAQSTSGDIYVATAFGGASAIHRLHVPQRGDCNGDGLTDWRDIVPAQAEVADGGPHPRFTAQDGAHRGSWGCDANGDAVIDEDDLHALAKIVTTRRRAARS